MLRELKLHRFKAFASEEKIPVRPITLIYGPNSSGKSSIIQSLLLLKQTMLEAENPNIPLLPKGKIVDLGGYRELVSGHEITHELSFKLLLKSPQWYRNAPFAFGPYRTNRPQTGLDHTGMAFSFTYDESLDTAILASLDVFLGEDEAPAVVFRPDTKQEGKTPEFYIGFDGSARSGQTTIKVERANYDHNFWKEAWSATNTRYKEQEEELSRKLNAQKRRLQQTELDGDISEKAKSRLKKIEKELDKIKNYTFLAATKDFDKANRNTFLTCSNFLPNDLRVIRPESTEVVDAFSYEPLPHGAGPLAALAVAAEIRRFLEAIIYIGPLREYPERHYIFSGNLANDVGKTGSMVPDILFKDPALLRKVNEHFESFEIGYRLEVASVGERRPELHDVFALRLVDKVTGVNVSVVDVGFGISQVLPIIVQSMLSKKKTLLIEQPEIHLHPRLQSELGGLLCEAIRPPYDNEFIVETHSEHLILRLQRLIRSGQLRSSELSVIYVDRTPDGSRCIPLRLDPRGEFVDRWPGGFFEESYHEIFS